MADVFEVAIRNDLGTSNSRRLRNGGNIPAVLYGHGDENLCLTIPSEQVELALRHGTHVVKLGGALSEDALIREVQWDPMGNDILHLDLTRVIAGEQVEITLAVELRGDAPGTREGGVVDQVTHELPIACPADDIPDKLEVNVNELNVGDVIYLRDIAIPASSSTSMPEDTIIVQCVAAATEEDEASSVADFAAEPEVIGRKPDEEGDE